MQLREALTTSGSVLSGVVEIVAGVQTEIAIFAVAVCFHWLLFSHRGLKVNRAARPKVQDPVGRKEVKRSTGARKHPQALSLAKLMDALMLEDAEVQVLAERLRGHEERSANPSHVMADAFGEIGKRVNSKLLAAVRHLVRTEVLKPDVALTERVLRGYYFLESWDEFDAVLAEMAAFSDGHASTSPVIFSMMAQVA